MKSTKAVEEVCSYFYCEGESTLLLLCLKSMPPSDAAENGNITAVKQFKASHYKGESTKIFEVR